MNNPEKTANFANAELSTQKKSIGIFGGTFDPPHLGHVGLAEQILNKCKLERIIFVPAYAPPHKPEKPISPFEDRVKMLNLAIKDYPDFEVSTIESELDKPSYTFHTLEHFSKQFSDYNICLIIGSDSLLQLHTWFKTKEIIQKWQIISYPRQGYEVDFSKLLEIWNEKIASKLYNSILDLKFFDMSSSEIRKKIANNEDCRFLLSPAVLQYALEKKLYSKLKES